MFRRVAAAVLALSEGSQQPEYLVRLTNEVYFKIPEPTRCDFLASAPYNSVGVTGVGFERIDFRAAIPDCKKALQADPLHPRLLYNLGRSHDAAGNFDTAVELYHQSSELGYAAATSSLGVMYINGQGTKQDFDEGTRLLRNARSLGSRSAKISLTYSDFSVLFDTIEFQEVQRRLKDLGHYSGSIDGDFGPASKKALENFHIASDFRASGLTLETLDGLGLLSIIPPYELN
ncbi:tetratricopeptide repeat protein [Parasedimentitalea psychrophila]|uniref:Peptidoglycan-binding protein n=1 Tax=Parasedimentitalea psychrophila TaxID=2997337 RepID=A0A9Y2KZK3_9RHOB|nr:tetratricopeptide repeat protein [Parasedimentitalea psychrophila]WIY24792.1 peptidoglycan-binding protein [Parasedimentitalea psychrophila]